MLLILIKEYFANKKGNRIDPLHTVGNMHAFHEHVLRLFQKVLFTGTPQLSNKLPKNLQF